MMYAFFVALGFLIGTRGGMHYQGDIDSFLSRHPELSRAELPWPPDYRQLSGKQKFLYSTRGFSQTIANGFLMPINFFLIGLTAIGVLKEEVAEKLFYRHDRVE